MWSALTDRVRYGRKIMMALTVFTSTFFVSAGHMTEILDPGVNGLCCSARKIEQLSRIMDEVDPTVLFAHVPCENDDNENNLSKLFERSRERGNTVTAADSRHSNRWQDRDPVPTLCRGDLAFHCNDASVAKRLVVWDYSRKNCNPL